MVSLACAVEGFNGTAWSLTGDDHENATIFLRPHDEAAESLALQRLKVWSDFNAVENELCPVQSAAFGLVVPVAWAGSSSRSASRLHANAISSGGNPSLTNYICQLCLQMS